MNPKKPKLPSSLPQIHLDLSAQTSPELEQTLTFETVEELLSYDQRETEVPDRIGRRLRVSLPGHEFKPIHPTPSSPSSSSASWPGRKEE
jgi:hypothetical protein